MDDAAYERALDELYAAPLAEFVARRTALSKALRAAGDRDGAARLAAQRKPAISAWLVNQVARREPTLVQAVLEATDELAHAQAEAAGRPEGRARFAQARAAQRERIETAMSRASAICREAGFPQEPWVERFARNLRFAGASAPARAAVRAGRLVEDVAAQTLEEVLAVLPAMSEAPPAKPAASPPPAGRAAPAKSAATAPRPRAEAERAREQARAAAAARQRALEEQLGRVRDSRLAVQAHEHALAERRAAARTAETELENARRALVEAERRATQSRAALAAAEAREVELQRALSEMQDELARLRQASASPSPRD